MKQLLNLKIRLHVLFHYLPQLFRELSPRQFALLLKRLNLFLGKLQHNKFARVGAGTRLDLYVPSYPGKAFFTACDKFKSFSGKLPCTGALLSVTSACPFACGHCYQRLDKGGDVELSLLVAAAKELQEHGVCFFNIEGGEPFLKFERLKAVCDAIDDRAEIWVNSTGYGMTPERLRELRITAVMFSLHDTTPEGFNRFMGRDYAWETLMQGVDACKQCSVPFALNTCLPETAFADGGFERVMQTARELDACLVQLIKPKPAGAWLEKEKPLFSPQGMQAAVAAVNRYNLDPAYRSYPPVSAQILEELPEVFGCTAGGTDRFYINAKGDVQPCEFLNISFGNIAEEPFAEIFARMRACFHTPGTCMLCETQAAKVYRLFTEHGLDRLPLPPALSCLVSEGWDRGAGTELYRKTGNTENLRQP